MNSSETCMLDSSSRNYDGEARDQALLRAARSGSHAAFAELQQIYSSRVFKRILSITRNQADAEDALQDTFLRAYLALPSFEGRSRLSSWLTRIGINSALMILRKRRRRSETSFEQHQEFATDANCVDIHDHALDPEQFCDQQQRCDAIHSALQQLDPKLQVVMRIRLFDEHSMQEIAQDLGVSVASVKSRLHRARKRLLRSPAHGVRKSVNSSGRNRKANYPFSREFDEGNSMPMGAVSTGINDFTRST